MYDLDLLAASVICTHGLKTAPSSCTVACTLAASSFGKKPKSDFEGEISHYHRVEVEVAGIKKSIPAARDRFSDPGSGTRFDLCKVQLDTRYSLN